MYTLHLYAPSYAMFPYRLPQQRHGNQAGEIWCGAGTP